MRYMLHTIRFVSLIHVFWDQVEVSRIFLWFFRIFWNFCKNSFSPKSPFCFHRIGSCCIPLDLSCWDASFETKLRFLGFFHDFWGFFEMSKYQFFSHMATLFRLNGVMLHIIGIYSSRHVFWRIVELCRIFSRFFRIFWMLPVHSSRHLIPPGT